MKRPTTPKTSSGTQRRGGAPEEKYGVAVHSISQCVAAAMLSTLRARSQTDSEHPPNRHHIRLTSYYLGGTRARAHFAACGFPTGITPSAPTSSCRERGSRTSSSARSAGRASGVCSEKSCAAQPRSDGTLSGRMRRLVPLPLFCSSPRPRPRRPSAARGTRTRSSARSPDRISAGAGNDLVQVAFGGIDTVDCGTGKDIVSADAADKVAAAARSSRASLCRPVREPGQSARHRGRARQRLVGRHRRRHLPARPSQRRRRGREHRHTRSRTTTAAPGRGRCCRPRR